MTSEKPGVRASEILRQLWLTLAAPLATELGSVVVLIVSAPAGIVTGVVAALVLAALIPLLRPPDGVTRVAMLIAGPPLRYALLLVAVAKSWLARGEGIVPALLVLLFLGFVVPLLVFVVNQARRARRGPPTNR